MPNVPQNPCENCGANSWKHATPKANKGALTRVAMGDDERLKFNAAAGTPVEIFLCKKCGMLRLFGTDMKA